MAQHDDPDQHDKPTPSELAQAHVQFKHPETVPGCSYCIKRLVNTRWALLTEEEKALLREEAEFG